MKIFMPFKRRMKNKAEKCKELAKGREGEEENRGSGFPLFLVFNSSHL